MLGRRTAHRGRRFDLEVLELEGPGGRRYRREVVRHPGSAVVLPVTDSGGVVLIRQYRVAVERWIWEAPAGTLEPGERPDVCARRELEEEAGLRCRRLRRVVTFYPAPGLTDERMHLYRAEGLRPGHARPDPGELIHQVRVFQARDLAAMVASGRIRDGKTLLGLWFILRLTGDPLPPIMPPPKRRKDP